MTFELKEEATSLLVRQIEVTQLADMCGTFLTTLKENSLLPNSSKQLLTTPRSQATRSSSYLFQRPDILHFLQYFDTIYKTNVTLDISCTDS